MPLKFNVGVNVRTLPAASDTVPLATATAAPPAVIARPSIAVICGEPSKLSAEAPAVPVTGLNVTALSSRIAVKVSAAISATGLMVRTKSSDADRDPSDAVTRIVSAPLKSPGGVPVNVRVAALNVTHAGSAAPLDKVAVYVRVESTSVKLPAGTVKFSAVSSLIV